MVPGGPRRFWCRCLVVVGDSDKGFWWWLLGFVGGCMLFWSWFQVVLVGSTWSWFVLDGSRWF